MNNKIFSQTNRDFVQAINHRDVQGIGSVYAKNARLLPPNSDMLEGRENIKAFWQGALDIGLHDIALRTVELTLVGDTAYEVGAYSFKIKTGTGESISDNGNFVVIWKLQEDGSWKWQIDIWNTNLPS
jgi:ketosteroid isomerase-like protein